MNKSNKVLNKKRYRKNDEDSVSEGNSEELSENEVVQTTSKVDKKKSAVKKSDDDDVVVGQDEITFKVR